MFSSNNTIGSIVVNFARSSISNASLEQEKAIDNDNSSLGNKETVFNYLSKLENERNVENDFSSLNSISFKNHIENFYEDQNIHDIRSKYSHASPFVDHTFPREDSSIYYSDAFKDWLTKRTKSKNGKFVWKRAIDLCKIWGKKAEFALDKNGHGLDGVEINEKNYKNYFHTTDLDQGSLGDCWFISAATGIAQNYKLFKTVVPFDNTFGAKYTGAFHFRFWIYGKWKDVVVDDYLPVERDPNCLNCQYGRNCQNCYRLIFSKNAGHPNEFWCSLLEKAYVKIYGAYECLEGGITSEAIIDMSGGVEEMFNLIEINNASCIYPKKSKNNNEPEIDKDTFWEILRTAKKLNSVIACDIEKSESSCTYNSEVKQKNGLVKGHAYNITQIAQVEIDGKLYNLVRLYNPWGNEIEWNGEFGDKSYIWKKVDNKTKKILDVTIDSDGHFWMPYEEWLKNFHTCLICNLSPETICEMTEDEANDRRLLSNIFTLWQCNSFDGKWISNKTAGGCGAKNPELFWTNPKFMFILDESDMVKSNNCWVIIALMQKYTRQKRHQLKTNATEQYIQYRLYKLIDASLYEKNIDDETPISQSDVIRIGSSGSYANKRETTNRFLLAPGAYVIIPSQYDENVEGDFYLRIFTEKPLAKSTEIKTKKTETNKTQSRFSDASTSSDSLSYLDDFQRRTILKRF